MPFRLVHGSLYQVGEEFLSFFGFICIIAGFDNHQFFSVFPVKLTDIGNGFIEGFLIRFCQSRFNVPVGIDAQTDHIVA